MANPANETKDKKVVLVVYFDKKGKVLRAEDENNNVVPEMDVDIDGPPAEGEEDALEYILFKSVKNAKNAAVERTARAVTAASTGKNCTWIRIGRKYYQICK